MFKKLGESELDSVFSYLEDRFGLSRDLFGEFEFLEASKGRVFIVTKEAADVARTMASIATIGLLFARVNEKGVKLSSNIAQLFGDQAKISTVYLEAEQAKKFVEGFDLDVGPMCIDRGYVIVKYKDYSLGIGLFKDDVIKNMLPKGKRMNVEI